MEHPERPPRPESECKEHSEKPPRQEGECKEHPHHKEHHHFPPSERGEHEPCPPERHHPPMECAPHHKEHHHPPFPPPGRMEHGPCPPEKRHHPPMECAPHDFDFYLALVDELSLSEEQVKQLQSITSKCEKNKIMSKARIKVGELELQELLNQSELDLSKVDAKIKEIGEIKIESALSDVHAMIDARAVLTQEQKEKLKKLRPIPCNGRF